MCQSTNRCSLHARGQLLCMLQVLLHLSIVHKAPPAIVNKRGGASAVNDPVALCSEVQRHKIARAKSSLNLPHHLVNLSGKQITGLHGSFHLR